MFLFYFQGLFFDVFADCDSRHESDYPAVNAGRCDCQARLVPRALLHWIHSHVPFLLFRYSFVALGRMGSRGSAFQQNP